MILISGKDSKSGGRNRKLKRALQHTAVNSYHASSLCICHLPGTVLNGCICSFSPSLNYNPLGGSLLMIVPIFQMETSRHREVRCQECEMRYKLS